MKKRLLPLLAAGLLIGCQGGNEANTGTGEGDVKTKELHIAVIPKGSTHEFWKAVHAGAQQAAEELEGVEIIWKGPIKEDDRDSQIKVVEDFTSQGVDGIVLAPLDDTALRQPVMNAQNSGIPVLIIDSGLKDAKTVSLVATDNLNGGQMAGDYLAGLLGGKGKVVMLRYIEGSASTGEREQGFLDVLQGTGIEVVSSNQFAGATTETAQRAAENLLQRFRNPDGSLGLAGVYTPNESSTFGMLRALQDNGWAGKVRFVGFDASPKLLQALEAGEIDGLVVQNPHNMGYLGVKSMVEKLRGGSVEERIDTGATMVTKSNMNEPEIQKLIAPPQ